MPENEDMVSKRAQRRAVGRHGVVSEIAGDDLREPFRRDLSQMSTKPRNLKVSGLERPRLLQFCAAKRGDGCGIWFTIEP